MSYDFYKFEKGFHRRAEDSLWPSLPSGIDIFRAKKMLKKLLFALSFLLFTISLRAQLVSYELLETYTPEDIVNMMDDLGVPAGLIVPEYTVNYYRVFYNTPYLHMDSLVQASGAIAVPQSAGCEFPIAAYHHGTQAKRMSGASTRNGGQWEVGMIFASTGYTVTMVDNLGLGFADPRVPIHPYIHEFSAGHTSVDMLRSCRMMADSLGFELNGQLFLFGYSQGGYDTMATQKTIEELYADEFTVTASAPMSGPYDLVEAQVDLIISEEVYPTPGYLPYLVMAYQSIYNNLYDDVSEFLIPPYDETVPDLFFSGENSIGFINDFCPPVPNDIVVDSVFNAFLTMPDHPLRENLRDNHLLEWIPEAPVYLLYCKGDDQVSYLNSENAYDSWTAGGAPNITKYDLGDKDHNGCALFCFLNGKTYFDSFRIACDGGMLSTDDMADFEPSIYPNPGQGIFNISGMTERFHLSFFDMQGKEVHAESNSTSFDLSHLPPGSYFCNIIGESGRSFTEKLIITD